MRRSRKRRKMMRIRERMKKRRSRKRRKRLRTKERMKMRSRKRRKRMRLRERWRRRKGWTYMQMTSQRISHQRVGEPMKFSLKLYFVLE